MLDLRLGLLYLFEILNKITIMRNLAQNLQSLCYKDEEHCSGWGSGDSHKCSTLSIEKSAEARSLWPSPACLPWSMDTKVLGLIAQWEGREECEQAPQKVCTDFYYTLYVLSWFCTTKHFLFWRKKNGWCSPGFTCSSLFLPLFRIFFPFCLIEAINPVCMCA